jgi:60S ribosomal protein uL30
MPKGRGKAAGVPESVQKKQATAATIQKQQDKEDKELKSRLGDIEKVATANAEKYIKEYLAYDKEQIDLRRKAKASGNIYVPPGAKVAVVMRIRGIIGIHPKVGRILQLLRLRQINNVVFVKLNKATLTMLNWVEPYISYGYPSVKTVKNLVYKRGFAKVERQRIPIMNNLIVDQNLGEFGIRCVEDLIHEIVTVGPHFKQANNFLWPFKVSNPKGGFSHKKFHYNQGGDAGNRGDLINQLLARCI